MSRFSKLIDQLEDLDRQDIANTAKIFGVAADLYLKLDSIVSAQALHGASAKALPSAMSKDDLITLKEDLMSKLDWVNAQLESME